MTFKLKYFLIFSIIYMLCGGGVALGACIGGKPVWGTDDDRVSCARKQQLKEEKRKLELEKQERELAESRQRLYDGKKKSGNDAPNVIIGKLQDILPSKEKEESEAKIILTKHQLRIELMPYLIPGAAQFDEPGTPEHIFPNGAAWEYYLNPNLGFGIIIQRFHKIGGKSFDPIRNNVNVAAGDATPDYQSRPVLFPGAIDRVTYTHLIPYATFNAQLGSPLWNAVCRFGIGMTKAHIQYKDINTATYPNATQPDDVTRSDMGSLLFDIGVERWAENFKYGGALRYVKAKYDSNDYNKYFNMGSFQFVIYAQWMIRPLGLL